MGLRNLSLRMVELEKQFGEGANRIFRRAVLVADQVAVTASPVDTGRLRGNWYVSVGSPTSERNEDSLDLSGASSIARGSDVVESMKSLRGNDLVAHVQNNLEYAGIVDRGSSLQAPEGMTRQAAAAARASVRGARVFP